MDPAYSHLLVVGILLTALATTCFVGSERPVWRRLFEVLVVISIVAGRWPAITAGTISNPDESQTIAGAATLWSHPEFWKWVDGTTIGPINFYALWLGKLIGLDFGYFSARLIHALFFAGGVIALHHFLRKIVPERAARLAALPFATYGALVLFWDIVQYGNESSAVFLTCLGLTLAFPSHGTGNGSPIRLALAGLALGAVPFAKLHLAPMALFVGVTALVAVQLDKPPGSRFRRTVALAVGAITVPTIVAVYLSIYGLWRHFGISYLGNNIAYVQSADFSSLELVRNLFPFLGESKGMLHLTLGTLAFGISCLWIIQSFPVRTRRWTLWSLAWIGISLLSLVLPGRGFYHYQLLLIPPLMVLCGCCLGGLTSMENPPARRATVIMAFVGVVVLPLAVTRMLTHRSSWLDIRPEVDDLAAVRAELKRLANPGDSLAIWGWQPELWVGTGLIQGTRDANTARQMYPGAHQDYYRGRYMFDIQRNMPPLFVDAASQERFEMERRAQGAHETWPELAAFVDEHYEFHKEIAGVRIYVKKDRSAR